MPTMLMAAALALQTASAATAESQAIQPVSKWSLDRDATKCTLQRTYAVADNSQLTLAIQAIPFATFYHILVLEPARGDSSAHSGTIIVRAGGGSATKVKYVSVSVPDQPLRLLRFELPRRVLGTAPGPLLAFATDEDDIFAVSAIDIRSALATIGGCEMKVKKAWGIDLAKAAAVATPAEAIRPERWISHTDYPGYAKRKGAQGRVIVRVLVGRDGDVEECKVIESSGTPELDGATCDAITARARYHPARDSAGKPIPFWDSQVVYWTLG